MPNGPRHVLAHSALILHHLSMARSVLSKHNNAPNHTCEKLKHMHGHAKT